MMEEIKVASENKNLPILNMNSGFNTFKLLNNSKNPSSEWYKSNLPSAMRCRTLNHLDDCKEINFGIICGKCNDIVVVDLDFYKDYPTEFMQVFGEKYIEDFNTFTVKTGSGGIHLYFKYTKKIKATQNVEFSIDIKSDGGYVVAPFTSITTDDGTVKTYDVRHWAPIQEIPDNLSQWINDKLYKKARTKKPRNPKIKTTNPITNEEVEEDQDIIDLGVYKYDLTDKEIEKYFIKGLDKSFFNEYGEYIKFATAMKTLGAKKLWKKYPKLNNPVDNNINSKGHKLWLKNTWDGITRHNELFCIEHLAAESKVQGSSNILKYTKYKPTECHTEIPNITINRDKLGKRDGEQIDFILEFKDGTKCIVARSDTGTGKTTATKKYLADSNKRFISIVSRISLGKEQSKVFKSAGIEVDYWSDLQEEMDERNQGAYHFDEYMRWDDMEGNNLVITIDSLGKLANWEDFYGYTIYLDEFNSLVEYFITCGNMGNKRVLIYKILNKILKEAELVVCTDADISDNSLELLKIWDIDYKYINNEYNHNNGVNATEIPEFDGFMHKLNKTPKWLCCADSKTMVDIMAKMSADKAKLVKVYTSDYTGDIDLDADDCILFSPKIVYGLDSVMERPVFCYYKCHTITPAAMVQQICRNRNITDIFFHFNSQGKGVSSYKYHDIEEAREDIIARDKYGNSLFKIIDKDMADEYVNLLSRFEYNYDCYNTNKFAHFLNILKGRGVLIKRSFLKTDDGDIGKECKAMKELKGAEIKQFATDYGADYALSINDQLVEHDADVDKINIELSNTTDPDTIESLNDDLKYMQKERDRLVNNPYNEEDELATKHFPEYMIRKNEILKIPYKDIGNYLGYFMDPTLLPKHLNCGDMFFNGMGDIGEDLEKKLDFNSNKATSNKSKVMLCRKYKMMIGLSDYFTMTPTDKDGYFDESKVKALDKKTAEYFEKEYKTVFRYRGKGFADLSNPHECLVFYTKMVKTLCGNGMIDKKKTSKDGVHSALYKYHEGGLKCHLKLLSNRKNMDEHIELHNLKDYLKDQ